MWVVILSIWKDEPVFHEYGHFTKGHEFTVCGREIGPYKPGLPRKHAEKFGRPCRGCFR